MAMITYDNKSTLNPQPSVANANKVTDGDMNEIKQVVNTNYGEVGNIANLNTTDKTSVVNAINELKDGEVYSTSEVKTNGVWIDNKPIYRKVIDMGSLPSSASAPTINHNITNIDKIISLYGIAMQSSGATLHIPHVGSENMSNNLYMALRATKEWVQIYVSRNASDYNAYVILEYTKTTD
jgi:hypothetical protein